MKLEGKGIPRLQYPFRCNWAVVLIAAVMLPSFYWIIVDHHVWLWDQSWYGEVSVDLWFSFTQRFSKWTSAMLAAFGGSKAPGIAFLGQFFVPFGRAIGSIETGLLCSILATQIGSVVLFYKVAKEYAPANRLAVAAGVLAFTSAPLFVALSHQYVAEPLQLFGVTYFYYLAVMGHRMPRVTLLGNLLLATSISLFSKSTSPIYCALPGLIATYALFQKRGAETKTSSPRKYLGWLSLIGGIILCVDCGRWYAANLTALLDYLKLAMSLDFTLDYGRAGSFFQKLAFWFHGLQYSVELPWVLGGQLALIGAGVALARTSAGRGKKEPRTPEEKRFDLLAVCSLVHILVVLSICSLNYSEETRYLLPLLPAVATINIWLVCKIRHPWFRFGVVTLLSIQWLAVNAQSLGWVHFSKRICSSWLVRLDKNREQAKEIARVARHTANDLGRSGINVVGVELPWLNANALSFFAAKEELITGKRSYYTSLGYKASDLDLAWKRMSDLKAGYFISLEESTQSKDPNFLNLISLPALRRIRHDSAFIEDPFPSTLGVVIFRRINEGVKGQSQESAQ